MNRIWNWKTGWPSRLVVALAPALLLARGADPEPPEQPEPPAIFKVMQGGSFLGVGVQEIDSERSKALKLKDDYGVEVTRVESDSPAAKAGLKVGDVLLEFNGQRVDGTEQFVRLIKETPAGRTVKLLVARGKSTMTVAATIGTRSVRAFSGMAPMNGLPMEVPRIEMMMPDVPKAMMSWRSGTLGVEAEALGGSQLAGFFGVKEGVLIRTVVKGTPAERAGLKAGDVLLKVDEAKVAAPRDVTSAIMNARASSKNSFPLVVMRDKKEVTLGVSFEDEASPRGQRVSSKP